MQVRRARVQSMETPAFVDCDTVAELIARGESEGIGKYVGKLASALIGTDDSYYTRYYIFLTDEEEEVVAKKRGDLRLTAKTERYTFELYSYSFETGTRYMAVVTPDDIINVK